MTKKPVYKSMVVAPFAALALLGGGLAQAQEDLMTKADVKALVKEVIALHKAVGKEKALQDCNSPKFYRKGDGYIFAYDAKGINVCHKNEKMRGKDLIEMKDANGIPLIQEMLKACQSKEGSGWIKYDWPNGVTKKVEQKESYAEWFDGVCYASGYLPKQKG